MYPERTPLLVTLLVICAAVAAYIAVRRPFLRKLALRQVARRRGEATLVVAGSVLGTAIIIGSLIVGDTLNFSVKQGAYDNLGPIDEIVASPAIVQGDEAARRLERLRGDPQVDGLLTVRGDQAAATTGSGGTRKADPRVSVWEVDFAKAAAFGGTTDGGSGLSGPAPGVGETVVNADLASALGIRAGDVLTVYLYGRPTQFRVARVVPTKGVAGAGTGAVTRNAFFAPGTLIQAAKATRSKVQPQTFTFVSNTGGVEGGNALSNAVDSKIKAALGPLAAQGTSVEKAKQRLLDAAKASGDSLGSFFLFIGSFSIIAGVLLLVNIFVMLAEERKSELGMLRAIGMKRSRLVRSFVIEGTVYALVASLVGIVVGIGVGRAVVIVAARIFNSFSAEEGGLALAFHVTLISIINGFAVGFLIAFLTVAITSMRISRINVIAAIRDLPTQGERRLRWRWVIASTILAVVFAAAAVPAIAASQGIGTYLYPALAVLFLCPLLVRFWPKRWVYTGAALAVLAWGLPANPVPDPARTLTSGRFAGRIDATVPLLVSGGKVTNLASLSKPVDCIVVGADPAIAEAGLYPLTKRLAGLGDDRAAWKAVMADRRYVILDQFLGSTGGGPSSVTYKPGDTLTLTDPATGKAEQKTIAGILKSGGGFYGIAGTNFTSPTIMSATAAREQFGSQAKLTSLLLKPAPGVSDATLAADLQGQFLPQSLVATQVRQTVEKNFVATRSFFQLMQGFLALGLLVGIAGLEVVMVRAVRERRRNIGVLRALGFPARTVQRAFLTESSFVALEGIVLGTALSIVTSYLLFQNDPSFQGTGVGFPIPWLTIAVLVGASAVASLLATFWPARQASQIRPAVALRIAD